MTPIEQLTEKASRNPEQAASLGDLKALITELKELGTWIESSNKVLNSRLIRLQRKCDSSYVFGNAELTLRQSVADLEKRQKEMQTIIQKITTRLR
jgi:hypothetical protein